MRPEKGLDEMEDKVYTPRELFTDIGLLITEARMPNLSPKGRIEGPHCPPAWGSRSHDCDRHKEQCRKAGDLQRVQDVLCQNLIPMRIDVLLFPNCDHGNHEETIIEGATFSCVDNFELLERWDVQIVKKRSPERMEGFVSGRVHLQAVRSHLHFSQLSSWLTSAAGSLPFKVVYRIYAPGEAVGYSFDKLPEVHNFPSAELENAVMQTTIAHLPRKQSISIILCRSPSPSCQSGFRPRKSGSEERKMKSLGSSKQNRENKAHNSGYRDNSKGNYSSKESYREKAIEPRPSTSKCDDFYDSERNRHFEKQTAFQKSFSVSKDYGNERMTAQNQLKQKPPIGRKLNEGKVEGHTKARMASCPVSQTPKRKVDQLSPTMKYAHDFPQVEPSSRADNYPCTSALPVNSKTCDNSNPAVTYTNSTIVMNDKDSLQNLPDFKTPEKVNITKHPLCMKPTSLTVSTSTASSYVGTKRLPSPKVIMTNSKKPEPSNFKKRCIDLDIGESAMENVEQFVGVNTLHEITSEDLHDLIKPLNPSDLEAYISSLSHKAPKRVGISKLDEIPTTKCSFFLGDEESFQVEETATKEPKVTEIEQKTNICARAPSLSTRDEILEENILKKQNNHPHVRNLFPENDKSNSLTLNKELVSSLETGQSSFDKAHNSCEDNCMSICDTEENKEPLLLSLSTKNNYTSDLCLPSLSREVTPDFTSQRESTAISQREINDKQSGEVILNDNSQSEGTSSLKREITCELSREVTLDESCSRESTPSNLRDRTLKHLSIPCSVGRHVSDLTNLAENLESMDIDEVVNSPEDTSVGHSNCTPQFPGENCVLDKEVEHHFTSQSEPGSEIQDVRNGSRIKGSLSPNGQISSKGASHSGALSLPDSCDTSPSRDLSLCKQLLQKEFQQNVKNEMLGGAGRGYKSLPSPDDIKQFKFVMGQSASAVFNTNTGLPSRSSPAPMKKKASTRFDYDCSLTNVRAIKNAISCSKLTLQSEDNSDTIEDPKILSTSAPASTNCLLGNFEESVLNGRIEPVGVVEGFAVEIGAGGTFCPKHVTLPVISYFFQLSDDNAPSPYLGYVNLKPLGKRGYHIPRMGTVQVTLFNPNKSVIKMFVVMYDLTDMPSGCQTFLRQRTMYTPVDTNSSEPSYLRYLIHLRFQSSKSGKIYLHTDIRLIFARDKFEFDPRVSNYELRSFTEGPENPKFSPKR